MKDKLFKAALEVINNSYSPYSGFKVACALEAKDKKIYTGVNVENASYGATNCAERTAIFSAVTQGNTKINSVLVMTESQNPWPPCGLCRQVISEFLDGDSKIYLANKSGIQNEITFKDIFPNGFSKENLNR